MTSSTVCILATIFVYLVGMLVIGFHYAKKNESSTDFYLGGRKLGPLVTAMSAEASDMSSYLLMGLPGLAYLSGVADVGWTAIGLAVGTYLNWLLTAGRLRRYTHKTDSFTLPQFFSHRFRDKKNILSCMAALIIIIFFIPYTASGFAACGKLFSSLFGMRYSISNTAEYGDYITGPKIVTEDTKKAMKKILSDIQDGSFAKEFLLDMSPAGRQVHFKAMRKLAAEHPSEKVGAEVRKLYTWNNEDKLINN